MLRKTKKPAKKAVKAKAAKRAKPKRSQPTRASKPTTTKSRTKKPTKLSATKFKRMAPFLVQAAPPAFDVDKLIKAKEHWSRQLVRRPGRRITELAAAPSPSPERNVVGVGIGERIAGGKHIGTVALKFFVRVKYPDDQLKASDKLPESVNGLPTDVEEVGTFRSFQDPRTMLRPGPPGCSVGFEDAAGDLMAGTFGALVKRGARRFVLSNNHVLADENQLPIGSPTFQPGFLDAGVPATTSAIGRLSAFVELRAAQSNLVDCAISEVDDLSLVTNAIMKIGVPKGTTTAQQNMIVHKFGRTTGFTVGFVDAVMMDVSVEYPRGVLNFENQIIVKGLNGESFSDKGDSGALILERNTSRAIGLLIAGSASHTIANHIGDVLQALNVSLS
ncbi:MAG: hypothetical protein ACRD9S_03465 [Pyrinomonadaceae bacterium]